MAIQVSSCLFRCRNILYWKRYGRVDIFAHSWSKFWKNFTSVEKGFVRMDEQYQSAPFGNYNFETLFQKIFEIKMKFYTENVLLFRTLTLQLVFNISLKPCVQ